MDKPFPVSQHFQLPTAATSSTADPGPGSAFSSAVLSSVLTEAKVNELWESSSQALLSSSQNSGQDTVSAYNRKEDAFSLSLSLPLSLSPPPPTKQPFSTGRTRLSKESRLLCIFYFYSPPTSTSLFTPKLDNVIPRATEGLVGGKQYKK